MHSHEEQAGEKVVIAERPARNVPQLPRRKDGYLTDLSHAFREQDITRGVGDDNDRDYDRRLHHRPPSSTAYVRSPGSPKVRGGDHKTRMTPMEINTAPIHRVEETVSFKK